MIEKHLVNEGGEFVIVDADANPLEVTVLPASGTQAEIEENYLPKAEVEANYIPKAEVQEKYVPKKVLLEAFKGFVPESTNQTNKAAAATSAVKHTCRYRITTGLYRDYCLYVCPPPPNWQDLGVPCPQ